MRIGVCDDENIFLDQVNGLIARWPNHVSEVSVELFDNGDSLLRAHSESPFDIIILDIVMPLLSGIETAAEIRQTDRNVKIVFLTSSVEFAIDSYSVKASNYLLKPVAEEKLWSCLDELSEEITKNSASIAIKSGSVVYSVKLENIDYMEAQNKKVLFYLSDGRNIATTEPMYAFEEKLLVKGGFFKCNRSYIVNIYKVSAFTQKEITMRSGTRIPLSRSCHKEFEETYFSLIFGKAGDSL